MYHDHLLFHTLPQLSTTVATRIRRYFELRHTVLSNTQDLPAFADTDHFLGYVLCPPSVRDWHRRLELPLFTTAMPPFPELGRFSILPIDTSSDYLGVALSPLPEEEAASTAPAAETAGPPGTTGVGRLKPALICACPPDGFHGFCLRRHPCGHPK